VNTALSLYTSQCTDKDNAHCGAAGGKVRGREATSRDTGCEVHDFLARMSDMKRERESTIIDQKKS